MLQPERKSEEFFIDLKNNETCQQGINKSTNSGAGGNKKSLEWSRLLVGGFVVSSSI